MGCSPIAVVYERNTGWKCPGDHRYGWRGPSVSFHRERAERTSNELCGRSADNLTTRLHNDGECLCRSWADTVTGLDMYDDCLCLM